MGRNNIDLQLLAATDFSITMKDVILPVFEHATSALRAEWTKYEESYDEQISSIDREGDESEAVILSSEKDWMEDIHRQRLQSVGILALNLGMISLQGALGAKKYLDKTHPPTDKYAGKNWLLKEKDEYLKRFQIDFDKAPQFERVQELVLARNAGIHDADSPPTEYMEKVRKPLFIGSDAARIPTLEVKRDELIQILKETEAFIEWVVKEIKRVKTEYNAQQKAATGIESSDGEAPKASSKTDAHSV
jgi:hypothetical protein